MRLRSAKATGRGIGASQRAEKNPAELPASRPNSGAGTEKRPKQNGLNHNVRVKGVKYKIQKKETKPLPFSAAAQLQVGAIHESWRRGWAIFPGRGTSAAF